MPATKDFLPAPFDWCEIPAGKVEIKLQSYDPKFWEIFDIPTFFMAKYPVTNAQYQVFVDAGGYENKVWWTEGGWRAKEAGWHTHDDNKTRPTGEEWIEPRYWKDERFVGDNKPVIGVSWHEAVAFCLWLSETTGEKIILPTEQQWQRAAQGDDKRKYPWGNQWDAGRCNNNIDSKGIGKTSPVTEYAEKGDSPFGVVDMIGNVWEWCLTEYITGSTGLYGTEGRVIRGCSWFNDFIDNFRVDSRGVSNPFGGNINKGFRIAKSL